MKIKLPCTLLFFVLFFTQGFSQTTSDIEKNNIEFSVGYNTGALKNLQFAPVARYDYNGLVYKLTYERQTQSANQFTATLHYLTSELQTDRIPVLNLDYSKIGLEISYLKRLYDRNQFSIHAGLQSRSVISIYSKENQNRTITDQSFGIASQFSYVINDKHAVFSKLAVPVTLLRVTNSDAGLYSLNRFQSTSWNIGYTYNLSRQLDLNLSYDFNYDRLQIQNSFREVQYQFNLGLNFKF